MGCSQAKQAKVFDSPPQTKSNSKSGTVTQSKWKLKRTPAEAKAHFIGDGTLPHDASPELLEFREFLEEPQLLMSFGFFAKNNEDMRALKCWADVLGFKNIDESCVEMAHSKAGYIFHRYLKEKAVEVLPDSLLEVAPVHQLKLMLTDTATSAAIPRTFFDEFHQKCLTYLCVKLYSAYKLTPLFAASTKEWKSMVNRVAVDDFEYFGKLGQGGFGIVVECRKKSTNVRYAMKIQTKVGLLDCFSDCPERVICEKQAMIACHHPFIVSMDYAFQTRTLAIMVMDLCKTGTLADALKESPRLKLSEERVRFYSAEIILALAHIHRMGLIFRDLKPENVLLNSDGHIQLVDLGGIIDVNGKVLGCQKALAEGVGLFAPAAEQSNGISSWILDEMGKMGLDESLLTMKPHQRLSSTPSERINSLLSQGGRSSSRDNAARSERIIGSKGSGASCGSSSGSYKIACDTPVRAVSIMGTGGYMAPEMLALNNSSVAKGYTASVDFWSLGVTMFKLLSGRLPFENSVLLDCSKFNGFADKKSPNCLEVVANESVLDQLLPLSDVSAECNDFIRKLFNLDGDSRLGSGGRKGILLIKHHAL